MAIIWPSMVAVLYTDDAGASMYSGWLNCISGTLICSGQIIGGCLTVYIGKTKLQCIAVLSIGGALLGAMASCTPDTKDRAIALMALGCFFIGWNETVCLGNAGIEVDDQQEIGTAVGTAGSVSHYSPDIRIKLTPTIDSQRNLDCLLFCLCGCAHKSTRPDHPRRSATSSHQCRSTGELRSCFPWRLHNWQLL